VQDVLRAVAAPGALVRADEHVRGCRVQVPVAAFAIRSQFQHMTSIDRWPRLEQAGLPARRAFVIAALIGGQARSRLPAFVQAAERSGPARCNSRNIHFCASSTVTPADQQRHSDQRVLARVGE
jgi:hypothetical protein